jgi:DeoR/GlpR family transcriptional regulator of sugar metabolism
MSMNDRRKALKQLLTDHGELELIKMAEVFDVSEQTIRRDFEALEDSGLLRRVVGGVIAIAGNANEPAFASRVQLEVAAKAHIGAAVADLLSPGEAVYFDGGSTALAVARAVRGRNLGLTALTSSLLVALELAEEPDTEVVVIGGSLRSGDMVTVDTDVENALRRFNLDTFVMGVSGVHFTKGLTEYHRDEAHRKQIAIAQSDRVILAVDSTKFEKVRLVHVADLEDVSIVVTDIPSDHPAIAEIRSRGVAVDLVEPLDSPGFAQHDLPEA